MSAPSTITWGGSRRHRRMIDRSRPRITDHPLPCPIVAMVPPLSDWIILDPLPAPVWAQALQELLAAAASAAEPSAER